MRRRSKPFIPSCVPDDVGLDGVLWNPTRDELLLEWHIAQIRAAHAEIAKIEAEENKAWLQKQTQRLALITLEIDEYKRREAMAAEIAALDEWRAQTAEREAEQTRSLLDAYQQVLDGPFLKEAMAKLERIGKEIRKESARQERQELRRRGVYKGRN